MKIEDKIQVSRDDSAITPDSNLNETDMQSSQVGNNVAKAANDRVPIRVWVILFTSSLGVFMASVSTSALIIAFPVVLVDLQMTLATMMWVLLVVLLIIGGVAGGAGKLGDIFGQAILYKFGYITFILGCLGGGLSSKEYNGMDLIAARVVIGFGAAFLFTNSSAILTNAFAPYNLVGLSTGIFQLTSAMGMVLGPLIGGAFAETNWRWIFFFNLPLGAPCAALAVWAVRQDQLTIVTRSPMEHVQRFDWIAAIFYPLGLVLLLIAMIQVVIPDPTLSSMGPLLSLIICGVFCGIIFLIDQFYAVDPLFPPSMFLNSRVFVVTTIGGTCIAFVRNSITYVMIFYLQGPYGMNPLEAGIALIPFGLGVMFAGLLAGGLADKLSVRIITMVGPPITIAACCGFLIFDRHTSSATVGGLLFLAGIGLGVYTSPNNMSNMLSVQPNQRGAAAAVGMLTMMFSSMLGICVTFAFVLKSMSQSELFELFIYGGGSLSDDAVNSCLDALRKNIFIIIATCAVAFICAMMNNFVIPKKLVINHEKPAIELAVVKNIEDDIEAKA